MENKELREKFEVWATDKFAPIGNDPIYPKMHRNSGDSRYFYHAVQLAWEAYQKGYGEQDALATKRESTHPVGYSTFKEWEELYWLDKNKYPKNFECFEAGRQSAINDYEEVLTDHCRLVRELDVALSGEAGAAKQASLCDLIGKAKQMREALEKIKFLSKHSKQIASMTYHEIATQALRCEYR